jgi:hypothetical protein
LIGRINPDGSKNAAPFNGTIAAPMMTAMTSLLSDASPQGQ